MRRIDQQELLARSGEYDRAVAAMDHIDHFCSSYAWIAPAHAAFHPESALHLYASDGPHFVALASGNAPTLGRYLAPLEAMWGLACPIIGADARTMAAQVVEVAAQSRAEWDALWLSGVTRGTRLFAELTRALGSRWRLGIGPTAKRHQASLEGGFDGFASRRTRRFRKNLRQDRRRAGERGVRFSHVEHADFADPAKRDALFERIMAIEARSWKGLGDVGVNQGGMREFYRRMLVATTGTGRMRAILGTCDDRDVAFIFGGLFNRSFRGLQVSFDNEFRHVGLGNVMQAEMIEALCAEGVADLYDLGSDMPYKSRWAEGGLETIALAVLS